MLLIPAIDLKDGHCVRLKQGDMDQVTVFSENPAEMARHWLERGARRLHLVDLNGAFAGKPKNESAVKAILATVRDFALEHDIEEIPVQLGGGIRDLDTIERYLDGGLSYIIIGTAAVKSPGFLHDACSAFPGQVIVGLDAKDGKVAVKGWVDTTGTGALDLARRMDALGVRTLIYTDIGTDGMLTGPNFAAQEAMLNAGNFNVIASGGVSRREDVVKLAELSRRYANLDGVIVGKALYEKRVELPDLLAIAR
jgi:phosphoribosylformimino-5-aminoimidazole carboxamide ribotide isomerase